MKLHVEESNPRCGDQEVAVEELGFNDHVAAGNMKLLIRHWISSSEEERL